MHLFRQTHWIILARWFVLLVVLGQSTLLLHESLHGADPGDTECQLCLHAQPQLESTKTIALLTASYEPVAVIAAQSVQAVHFSPVYSNSSRGPPRA